MSSRYNKSIEIDKNSIETKKYNRCYLILGIILMLSEIWKQYTLTFVLNNGEYQWSYIPFQLCSMPMYLCLFLGISGMTGCGQHTHRVHEAHEQGTCVSSGKEKTAEDKPSLSRIIGIIRRGCKFFLTDYSLMSGLITFLDTSGLHYGYAPLTIHSYLWHITIAAIGVYSGWNLIYCQNYGNSYAEQMCLANKVSQADICRSSSSAEPHPDGTKSYPSCEDPHTSSMKMRTSCTEPHIDCIKTYQSSAKYAIRLIDFVPASCIFLIGCGIAEIINLSFDRYGTIDMFYINPHYYVNQMVFYDLAHIIPNNIVIVLYILCAMLAAFIVHLFWMSRSRKRL